MRSAASLSDIVSLPERQSRGQHEQPPSFYSGFKRPTTLVCAPRCRGSLPINYLSPPELLSGCAPRPTPSMGGCVSGHFRPHREVAQCDMTGLARVNLHHKQVHTWRRTSNLSITPHPPRAASTSCIFFFFFCLHVKNFVFTVPEGSSNTTFPLYTVFSVIESICE